MRIIMPCAMDPIHTGHIRLIEAGYAQGASCIAVRISENARSEYVLSATQRLRVAEQVLCRKFSDRLHDTTLTVSLDRNQSVIAQAEQIEATHILRGYRSEQELRNQQEQWSGPLSLLCLPAALRLNEAADTYSASLARYRVAQFDWDQLSWVPFYARSALVWATHKLHVVLAPKNQKLRPLPEDPLVFSCHLPDTKLRFRLDEIIRAACQEAVTQGCHTVYLHSFLETMRNLLDETWATK